MKAAVVLEPFLDTDRDLGRQAVVPRVDRRTNDRREAGVDQNLTADDGENPGSLRVLGRGVDDPVELAAPHCRIW
jgi:hypothetical protein